MSQLHKLSRVLHRVSTGWVALAATALFIVFMVTVLPAQASNTAAATGGVETPDTMRFYTASELYATAEALGEAGRSHYIQARWTFDVVWPLVYLAFLVTTISWLLRRGFAPHSRWQLANLVPVAAWLFDLLENTATSLVMLRFPAPTPVVAEVAGIFTALKWATVSASFVLLGIALIAAGVQWLRARRARATRA